MFLSSPVWSGSSYDRCSLDSRPQGWDQSADWPRTHAFQTWGRNTSLKCELLDSTVANVTLGWVSHCWATVHLMQFIFERQPTQSLCLQNVVVQLKIAKVWRFKHISLVSPAEMLVPHTPVGGVVQGFCKVYLRCQKRKCPIFLLDRALSRRNLVRSQSR